MPVGAADEGPSMTLMTDLCATPLDMTHGVPSGLPGYKGYRFAVEIAVVNTGSLLGTFILGPGTLGGPRWTDLTHDVQGLSWGRGGDPAQRPIAGQLSLRLLNTDSQYAPWQSPFYGPGTLLRLVIGDGVVTKPLFTSLTQSWVEASEGMRAYQWVDVTAWETMSLLSESDDNALAGVVGGGENLAARVGRLLTKADWQFGSDIVSTVPATFQATDLAQDVLTELYRTLDSIDAVAFPGKDGKLVIRDRAVGTGVSWTIPHEYQNDSFVTANDDERLLSSVDLSRVGGTAVTYTNTGVAGRYQKRSTHRNDLITVAEAADADLLRVAVGMLARSQETYRPVSFEVQSGQGASVTLLLLDADITDRITVQTFVGPVLIPLLDEDGAIIFDEGGQPLYDEDGSNDKVRTFTDYSICGMRYDVQVAASGTYFRGTIYMDIEADSSVTII